MRVTIPFEFELESEAKDVPQDVPQVKSLDVWIEDQIRKNLKATTEELAMLCGKTSKTIKRHISNLSHIKYVGSGYSGHWEIVEGNRTGLQTDGTTGD